MDYDDPEVFGRIDTRRNRPGESPTPPPENPLLAEREVDPYEADRIQDRYETQFGWGRGQL